MKLVSEIPMLETSSLILIHLFHYFNQSILVLIILGSNVVEFLNLRINTNETVSTTFKVECFAPLRKVNSKLTIIYQLKPYSSINRQNNAVVTGTSNKFFVYQNPEVGLITSTTTSIHFEGKYQLIEVVLINVTNILR